MPVVDTVSMLKLWLKKLFTVEHEFWTLRHPVPPGFHASPPSLLPLTVLPAPCRLPAVDGLRPSPRPTPEGRSALGLECTTSTPDTRSSTMDTMFCSPAKLLYVRAPPAELYRPAPGELMEALRSRMGALRSVRATLPPKRP